MEMKKFILIPVLTTTIALSACSVLSGDRTINQFGSDSATTANVKAELLNNPKVTSLPIHVDTDQGTVVLSGFVKNNEQKNEAARAAAKAKGARIVQNKIVVRR